MAGLPKYATCPCGEYHRAALKSTAEGVRCANCRDTRHRWSECAICGRVAPFEDHHIAHHRNSPVTVPACLNCHRVLSNWQYRWRAIRPLEALVQGIFDCNVLRTEQDGPTTGVIVGLLTGVFVLLLVQVLPRLDPSHIVQSQSLP